LTSFITNPGKEKWCSLCEVSFENIDLLKDHKKGSDGGGDTP
ncbi:17341_t:CDS:1, partial [Funneliformis geosporum]